MCAWFPDSPVRAIQVLALPICSSTEDHYRVSTATACFCLHRPGVRARVLSVVFGTPRRRRPELHHFSTATTRHSCSSFVNHYVATLANAVLGVFKPSTTSPDMSEHASSSDDGNDSNFPGNEAAPRRRDPQGSFISSLRLRRKRQEPSFRVIELIEEEPFACGAVDEGDVSSVRCTSRFRCSAHGGTQCRQWHIRGPVAGFSDDAVCLHTTTKIRAAVNLPPHEVFARSVQYLVPGIYRVRRDMYNAVRFVVSKLASDDIDVCTGSSFHDVAQGDPLDDALIELILKRAATTAKRAKKPAQGGLSLMGHDNAYSDTVYKSAVRGAMRHRSVQALQHFRRNGAREMRRRAAGLNGVAAGSIARMRRLIELKEPANNSGRRATRLKLSRGLSQMHVLPARLRLRKARKEAIDDPGRVAHYLFTKTALGEVQQWRYILGSASQNTRRYSAACGEEKCLQTHQTRFWEERAAQTADAVSEDEDNGFNFDNTNAEYDGLYVAEETDPIKIEELEVNAKSFLESDDGSARVEICAVGYDVIDAIQQALDRGTVPGLTASDVNSMPPAVLTFAADGGSVRRKDVTAYTMSLSSPCIIQGRTDLTPVIYAFSGEKGVERGLCMHVRDMLAAVINAPFTVVVDGEADGTACQPPGASDRDRLKLPVHDVLQVCGTCGRSLFCLDLIGC